VYNGVRGLENSPEAGEFSRIVVLKVTLRSVRLLLTVSYRKKLEEQDVLVATPIILLGSSCFPVLRSLAHDVLCDAI